MEHLLEGQKHAEVMTKLYVRMNEVSCFESQMQCAETLPLPLEKQSSIGCAHAVTCARVSCMHQGIGIHAFHQTEQPLCAECMSAASGVS